MASPFSGNDGPKPTVHRSGPKREKPGGLLTAGLSSSSHEKGSHAHSLETPSQSRGCSTKLGLFASVLTPEELIWTAVARARSANGSTLRTQHRLLSVQPNRRINSVPQFATLSSASLRSQQRHLDSFLQKDECVSHRHAVTHIRTSSG